MLRTAGFLSGGSCVAAPAPDGPRIVPAGKAKRAANASLRFIAPPQFNRAVIVTNAAPSLIDTLLIVALSLNLVNALTQWVENRRSILKRRVSRSHRMRTSDCPIPVTGVLRFGVLGGSRMLKSLVSLALLVSASDAWAASSPTDFGIRAVGVRTSSGRATTVTTNSTSKALLVATNPSPARSDNTLFSNLTQSMGSGVNLRAVASLGSQWGRVTSTIRSISHNRAVGGVRNSWHLSGRAVDIARRPGVTHAQIAAAFRAAGYHLIESLDEGDHSHFAFGGSGGRYLSQAAPVRSASAATSTQWKIVSAANAAFR